MKRPSVSNVLAVLLALYIGACATAQQATPEVPRLQCLNMGAVPGSGFFVYLCSFTGDSVTVESDAPLITAGTF